MSDATQADKETILALADEQKIAILEGAREILGPNGEHWTKSCWWGIKLSRDEINELLEIEGYDPTEVDDDQLKDLNENSDYEFDRKALNHERADEANVWCLMGALEESAFRLGITQHRDASERLASPVSLQALVETKEEWLDWSVIDVNDHENTTFEMVRDLIDERLAQLRPQQ